MKESPIGFTIFVDKEKDRIFRMAFGLALEYLDKDPKYSTETKIEALDSMLEISKEFMEKSIKLGWKN